MSRWEDVSPYAPHGDRVPCDLTHVCTRCAHGGHDTCRRVMRCPNDRVERACECCGQESSE